MNYASNQEVPFRRRDLMEAMSVSGISPTSAHIQLSRLVEQGKLIKAGYGLYAMPKQARRDFIYTPSEEEKELARNVREKFPFADFCIWRPSVLVPFMRHIPVIGMTLIDVERVAMESAFHFLQGIVKDVSILLNPNVQECERYITTDNVVIVRPFIMEAPIVTIDNCPVPTLEKILVDAVGDKELNFAQGTELYTIFENAFSENNVNVSRLLRYASRRNRKETIQEIIQTIEQQ